MYLFSHTSRTLLRGGTIRVESRGRPKFGFGFSGKSGPVYSFGLLSSMAESQIETFGSVSVSAERELYFQLVGESRTVEPL